MTASTVSCRQCHLPSGPQTKEPGFALSCGAATVWQALPHKIIMSLRTEGMTTVFAGHIDEHQPTWATQHASRLDRTWRNLAEASLSRLSPAYSRTPLLFTFLLNPSPNIVFYYVKKEIGIRNNNDKHRELPFYNTKFLVATRTGHHSKITWWCTRRLRTHQLSMWQFM